MIQQSMRFKVFILPLTLAAAVVVLIFFIKPAYQKMGENKASLVDEQTKLENLQKQNQQIQALEKKMEAMADDKLMILNAVPNSQGIDYYISELSSKASRSGVLLSDTKVGDQAGSSTDSPGYICGAVAAIASPPPVDPMASSQASQGSLAAAPAVPACLNAINLTMTAKGSWEQMLEFFKYLEGMNRVSNITSLTLSANDQATAEGQAPSDILNAAVSARVFFKTKPATADPVIAGALAQQGNFNQKAIEKIKNVIYASYSLPNVPSGGQRNLFK